eukprot:gene20676-4725_t
MAWDPLCRFLGQIAAARTGLHAEVERVTRESAHYDAATPFTAHAAKRLLADLRLSDQWPFINVCHRHGLTDEMVRHLLDTKSLHYLDQYCSRRGAERVPDVLCALIDAEAGEQYSNTST